MADTLISLTKFSTHSPFNYLVSYMWQKNRLHFSNVTPTSSPRSSLPPKENDMAVGTRLIPLALAAIIYITMI